MDSLPVFGVVNRSSATSIVGTRADGMHGRQQGQKEGRFSREDLSVLRDPSYMASVEYGKSPALLMVIPPHYPAVVNRIPP